MPAAILFVFNIVLSFFPGRATVVGLIRRLKFLTATSYENFNPPFLSVHFGVIVDLVARPED
jgi:hypothetical protein